MDFKPLVSVIIDNYNYGRFIAEAINSVLSQTYTNYEIIIVDDGSNDNSREVIDKYYKRYPDKITPVYKDNGGQASAFNAGFKVARGDIIAFLDSDDYWFEDKLKKIIIKHKDYAIIQHNLMKKEQKYTNVMETGRMIRRFFTEYGCYAYVMPTSALSFTHQLLERVFPIPETGTLRICADSYIAGHALQLESIGSVDECLGMYRVHGNNLFYEAGDSLERGGQIIAALNEAFQIKGLPLVPYHKTQGEAWTKGFINEVDISPGKVYLIYGVGGMGQTFYEHIVVNGGIVRCFSDSSPAKWGTFFNHKEVIRPEDIDEIRHTFDKIVIGSMYIRDILKRLIELGYKPQKDIVLPQYMSMNE